MDILVVLIVGAVGGYLIGMMRKVDLLPSLVLGVIGGFLGHFFFGMLKITFGGGLLGGVITGFLGAAIVVLLFSLIKKHA